MSFLFNSLADNRIKHLEEKLQDQADKLLDLEDLTKFLQNEVESKEKHIIELKNSIHDHEIFKNSVDKKEDKIRDLETKVSLLTREALSYVEASKEKDYVIQTMVTELQLQKVSLRQNEARIQELGGTVRDLDSTRDTVKVKDDIIEELMKKIDNLAMERNKLATTLDAFPHELIQHSGVHDQRVLDLEKEIVILKQHLDEQTISFTTALEEKKMKIGHFETSFLGTSNKMKKLEKDFYETASELTMMTKLYEELQEKFKSSTLEACQLQNSLSETLEKVSELEKTNNCHIMKIDRFKEDNDVLRIEMAAKKQEVDTIKNEYQVRCKQNFKRLVATLSHDLQESLSVPDLGMLRLNGSINFDKTTETSTTAYSDAGFEKVCDDDIGDNFSVPDSVLNLNEDDA